MHNGGAYGSGTTKSGVGFVSGAARTAGGLAHSRTLCLVSMTFTTFARGSTGDAISEGQLNWPQAAETVAIERAAAKHMD